MNKTNNKVYKISLLGLWFAFQHRVCLNRYLVIFIQWLEVSLPINYDDTSMSSTTDRNDLKKSRLHDHQADNSSSFSLRWSTDNLITNN